MTIFVTVRMDLMNREHPHVQTDFFIVQTPGLNHSIFSGWNNFGLKILSLSNFFEYFFSSRVNDMICDCCDGSDEWGGYVTCPNTCKELYKQYYAERIKSQEEAMEGYKIRPGINMQ